MCEYIDIPNVAPGFGCCHCSSLGLNTDGTRTYNGLQRKTCKRCGVDRCAPLGPDKTSGRTFETYEAAGFIVPTEPS